MHFFLNQHVCLKLRLKCDSVASPTARFGFATLSLTKKHLHKMDVVQRRMLRSIVGQVGLKQESWHNTMADEPET